MGDGTDLDLELETPGAQQGLVDHVDAVGHADQQDVVERVDAINLGQQLVHHAVLNTGSTLR